MGNKRHSISRIETTKSSMTSRAGMNSVAKFLEKTGVIKELSTLFSGIKKNNKGLKTDVFFKQMLCFFFQGDNLRISEFNNLKSDESYAKLIELPLEDLGSSESITRMFANFNIGEVQKFKSLLKKIFKLFLKRHDGKYIELTVDSMVLDNNDSKKKGGNTPTYKKVLGFQPLHLIFNGLIADMSFRGGSTHGNSGNTAKNMIVTAIKTIRGIKGADYPIIFKMDSGFMDEEIFNAIEENNAFFVCSGKKYNDIKSIVEKSKEVNWRIHAGTHRSYRYLEFKSKCKSWDKNYRTFYTALHTEEDGQSLINFDDSENVIYTNIEEDTKCFDSSIKNSNSIIAMHHSRGADELPHRGIKEFGTEIMPFKRYYSNHAFYALMVISFNMFELYKREVIREEAYLNSYANKIRRKFIDIAGFFVKKARQTILKVNEHIAHAIKFVSIWDRSQTTSLIV